MVPPLTQICASEVPVYLKLRTLLLDATQSSNSFLSLTQSIISACSLYVQ